MKKLTCDLCDHEAQGETFEEWMNALKPHYAEAHKDFMMQKMTLPKEEQEKEMRSWMEENKERFTHAKET